MRIIIAAVGRSRPGPERRLYDQYAARIRLPLLLKEVEVRRSLPCQERVKQEGKHLLSCVPPHALLVALDERGQTLNSQNFAALFQGWKKRPYRFVLCFSYRRFIGEYIEKAEHIKLWLSTAIWSA